MREDVRVYGIVDTEYIEFQNIRHRYRERIPRHERSAHDAKTLGRDNSADTFSEMTTKAYRMILRTTSCTAGFLRRDESARRIRPKGHARTYGYGWPSVSSWF